MLASKQPISFLYANGVLVLTVWKPYSAANLSKDGHSRTALVSFIADPNTNKLYLNQFTKSIMQFKKVAVNRYFK